MYELFLTSYFKDNKVILFLKGIFENRYIEYQYLNVRGVVVC